MANELLSTNKIFKTCLQIPPRDVCLYICLTRVYRYIQAYTHMHEVSEEVCHFFVGISDLRACAPLN